MVNQSLCVLSKELARIRIDFYSVLKCIRINWNATALFFDFSLTVKAAPHECAITIGQP